jgi:hypothetical protein
MVTPRRSKLSTPPRQASMMARRNRQDCKEEKHRMRPGIVLSLMAPLLLSPVMATLAATPDNFQLNKTSDLVALCSPDTTDPMMAADVSWCHGFVVGTYRILEQEEMKERHKAFCMANPPPNRNDAIAAFVAWVKANPSQLTQSPSDSILSYLESSYPCKVGK